MNVLIVLTARTVNQEIEKYFGKIPPVMIPFEKGTVLDKIYEENSSKFDKIMVVAYENADIIEDYIENKKYDFELIKLDELNDIGYSLRSSLEIIKSEDIENITVIFGDTLLKEENLSMFWNKNVALYSKTFDCERWTVFEKNLELKIFDKDSNLDEKKMYNTFIGVFNFINEADLKNLSFSIGAKKKLDSFYEILLSYSKKNKMEYIEITDWIDLGHEDNYINAKKDVETRHFNSIEIDKEKGILTKRSSDTTKFINEIKWYLKLPSDLEYLTPRIFNYSLDFSKPFVEMEYYSYNNLHNMFVYGNYSLGNWEKIIKTLLTVNKKFRRYVKNITSEEIKKILHEIYYEKTRKRLNLLRSDENFNKYFKGNIIVNNREYKSLDFYLDNLNYYIEEMGIYNLKELNVIHGDFFFANILYDTRCNMVRLIDPRGDFGGYIIYGDNRYELAKLSHSVDGKYDFIVEDLFEIEVDSNRISYKLHTQNKHEEIKNIFYSLIENIVDIKHIKFIQALLFLSMIPLHKDNLKRQQMMLATGLELLEKSLLEIGIGNRKEV